MNKLIAVLLAVALFFVLARYEVKSYDELAASIQHPYATTVETHQGAARDMLDDNLRQLYDRVKTALLNHESEALIRRFNYDETDIRTVLWCVMQDSPDIFWVDWTLWTHTNRADGFTLAPNYLFTKEETAQKKAELEQACDEILTLCAQAGAQSDFDRVKFIHDYLIDAILYEKEGPPEVHTAYGALTAKTAVCDGYAHAFQLLMSKLEIACFYVEGYTSDSKEDEGHAWNIVQVDGNFYQIDLTWDDIESDIDGTELGIRSYCYFLISDEEMFQNHIDTSPLELPACDSYGYMQGMGFSGAAFSDIEDALMEAAYTNARAGRDYVEFVITDAEAYTALRLDEETVGGFVRDLNDKLAYAGSSVRYTGVRCYRIMEERGYMAFQFVK